MPNQQQIQPPKLRRLFLAAVCLVVLLAVYLFQRFDYFNLLFGSSAEGNNFGFIFNKSLRLLVNDAACLGLIWSLFHNRRYLSLATYLLLVEVLVILPLYFWIKLSLEGTSEISSPLLSQIHRLIVNPTLMILLIVSFFYQRFRNQRNTVYNK